MQLIALVFTLVFSQPVNMELISDSTPVRTVQLDQGVRQTLNIKKKIEVFIQATGREWEYKFSKEPDGRMVGMFCNKVMDHTLKDRKRLDTLANTFLALFFEDCIFDNKLYKIKSLGFCFTTNMDACFSNSLNSIVYSYHYLPDDLDTTSKTGLTEKAILCAIVLGQGATADLYWPHESQRPGEIVLFVPRQPKDRIKDRIKAYADRCARLAYIYLLTAKEAEDAGFSKISICYYNNGDPLVNSNVWQTYTYSRNNPLFNDLR